MEDDLSTEQLLRQMSLARQAIEQARQQAQVHISAVLKGHEERLGALHSETERQQAEGAQREVVAQCFRLWKSLPVHTGRADVHVRRAVTHWRHRSTSRCVLAWARVVRASAQQEAAGLQARLDAAMMQLSAVSGAPRTLTPPAVVATVAGGSGLVVQLTQKAQQEMQATVEDLEQSVQHHSDRHAEATARHAEVRTRHVPIPHLLPLCQQAQAPVPVWICVAVRQAARELETVEGQIDAHEQATSAAQVLLQRVRGDLELGATGRLHEQNHRGWVCTASE